jgi:hypothetical protein
MCNKCASEPKGCSLGYKFTLPWIYSDMKLVYQVFNSVFPIGLINSPSILIHEMGHEIKGISLGVEPPIF